MKQIWPDYSYSPATNVLTLTGLNIDRDQLLLVTAADRGRIMYNFADSSVTASAFTSGANTALTLVATTAGLTTTAALVIYFDDQATSSTVTGTVELGPTSLNALESITVTMGQVTVTGGLTDVQLRASPVTVGGTVTVGNFPASQAVTFAAVTGSVSVLNFPASQAVTFSAVSISNFPSTQPVSIASVTVGNTVTIAGTVTANPTGTQTISGTVTANTQTQYYDPVNEINLQRALVSFIVDESTGESYAVDSANGLPISGTVTLGAGTAQIGSVTASISNSVTIASLPAISGTVTANLSISSTVITSGSFSSLSSATLVPENPARKMATVFNLGAGQLFINAGATATTLGSGFMVALSSGDFYECDYTTTTLSAIFATAGTASWVSH
jgi:trimeric autotransporter adhesin